ncbi:MAG: hypothetical protein M3007_05930 [Candidatus Eremiobacteraeota bacterium]|nr:hypothetical protein [Candidatus Eremiobacteraeota bacterium]
MLRAAKRVVPHSISEGNSQNANTIGVPSVDEYLKKVTAARGKVVQPKGAIPGVGWFAKFADTEEVESD